MEFNLVILVLGVFFILVCVPIGNSGVPPRQADTGLYDANDKVIILTKDSFNPMVIGQNYAILIEFYNSFCGHCRRFASKYKELAEDIWNWRQYVKVMAIDCAAENNYDVCREYEVMAYPTLRYFGRFFKADKENLGVHISSQEVAQIRSILAEMASNETRNETDNWPHFTPIHDTDDFFQLAPHSAAIGLIVYDTENSTLGAEIILNYTRVPELFVRRTIDYTLANHLNLDDSHRISIIDRNSNVEPLIVKDAANSKAYQIAINNFLKSKGIVTIAESTTKMKVESEKLTQLASSDDKIIRYVKNAKNTVYQADLEQALKYTIFVEIPKFEEISNERLHALQRYITLIKNYSPLGSNGKQFLQKLYEYVMEHNEIIHGKEFENKVKSLEKIYTPMFSSSKYIGCIASKAGLRGFTCGLWQLFHFMTVQSAESDNSADPLEVLQAMHGYVKYFFGCTDCSNHFQAMATRRKIWNTPSKDEAILWLWSAHNVVNERLSGDATEDPKFPKIQYPTKDSCSECYRELDVSPSNQEINWNKIEVLNFLKRIHCVENISRYGVDNESILTPTLEKLRQKRFLGSVFSDIDMRMGLLLYGFCIVMMIIAVKLFLYKGYRKKPYTHDYLGKV